MELDVSKKNYDKKDKYQKYIKIFGKKIFDCLNDDEKKDLIDQIETIEKELGDTDGIKIRVRPKIIELLRKITGVHDFRGGAYFADAIYLSHHDDVFNKRLINHELIHLKQQQEMSSIKLIGFLKWLILNLKDIKKYKQQNRNHKYVNYEATVMIPTELESYSNERDWDYTQTRRKKNYENIRFQTSMKKIEKANYDEVKQELLDKGLFEEIEKLESIMKSTEDNERIMRVFNNVDRVNDLEDIKELLLLKIKIYKDPASKLAYKYKKIRQKKDWAIHQLGFEIIFDGEKFDQKLGIDTLNNIEEQIRKYRRQAATIRLESKKNVDNVIEMGIGQD